MKGPARRHTEKVGLPGDKISYAPPVVVWCGKDAESGWTGQPLTHYPKMKIN